MIDKDQNHFHLYDENKTLTKDNIYDFVPKISLKIKITTGKKIPET